MAIDSLSRRPDVPAPRRTSRVASRVLGVVPVALVVATLYLWLPLAAASPPVGIGILVVVVAATLVLVLGLERSAVVMLTLGFVAAPMNAVRPVPGLSFASAADLLFLVAILLLVPLLVRRRLEGQAWFVLAAGGVVVASIVVSLTSVDPYVSFNIVGRLVVGAFVLPIVFALWRPGRWLPVVLAGGYVLGNCISVAYGVTLGDVSVEGRYPGLSTHANVLGLCAMLGLALVPFLLQEVPRLWRAAVLVGGLGCAYGVWVSGSRAAFAVAVVVAVLYPVVARSVPAAIALFGGGVLGLWVVARALLDGETGTNTLGRFFGAGSATASDLQREQEAQQAIDNFFDDPLLGGGFSVEILDAHNIFIQVAGAGGLLLLGFYLLVLGAVVHQALSKGPRYYVLLLPVAGYLMIGPLTPLLWDRYIWCVLALPFLLAPHRRADAESDQESTTEELVTS